MCSKHSLYMIMTDMMASHSCSRFHGCTSMIWSPVPTRSIRMWSGDYGGSLSKVNRRLCTGRQCEMIWALWRRTLSCRKHPREDLYTVVIKGQTWLAAILGRMWCIRVGFKVCQETIPHTITPPAPTPTFARRQNGAMHSCCLQLILILPCECCSTTRY